MRNCLTSYHAKKSRGDALPCSYDICCLATVATLIFLADIEDGEAGSSESTAGIFGKVIKVDCRCDRVYRALPRNRGGSWSSWHNAGHRGIVTHVHCGPRTCCNCWHTCSYRIKSSYVDCIQVSLMYSFFLNKMWNLTNTWNNLKVAADV